MNQKTLSPDELKLIGALKKYSKGKREMEALAKSDTVSEETRIRLLKTRACISELLYIDLEKIASILEKAQLDIEEDSRYVCRVCKEELNPKAERYRVWPKLWETAGLPKEHTPIHFTCLVGLLRKKGVSSAAAENVFEGLRENPNMIHGIVEAFREGFLK